MIIDKGKYFSISLFCNLLTIIAIYSSMKDKTNCKFKSRRKSEKDNVLYTVLHYAYHGKGEYSSDPI